MTQDGQVFELQTQAHLTSDSEFSSLPTPLAMDYQNQGYEAGLRRGTPNVATIVKGLVKGDQRVCLPTPTTMDKLPARSAEDLEKYKKHGISNLREAVIHNLPTPAVSDNTGAARSEVKAGDPKHRLKVAVELLRSPTASQGEGGALGEETARARGNTVGIRDQAMDIAALNLLPTTRTSMANGASQKELDAGNPKGRLETVTNWGKFEPAIRRWEETIGRPAPAPTKPDGKDGNHRLSSAFTEWMMGLPQGWITDVGLKRNEELKACGNGVVPQQAELALRMLLEGIEIEAGGGQANLPTPTVSDTFTDNLRSTQQKEGSMHSVTLPQAVRMIANEH
jgi:hypothetical protein